MTANDSAAEKRIVDQLFFGATTAKRVGWEAWEFTVVGPYLVEVTNASYGHLKDDHTYTVGVAERDGVPIPAECECPADTYNEESACKHRVALATVGGPTVLRAAVNCGSPAGPSSERELERAITAVDLLQTDGGTVTAESTDDEVEPCPNDDPRCDGPDSEKLPCFACYRNREQGDAR